MTKDYKESMMGDIVTEKRCTYCGIIKEINEFRLFRGKTRTGNCRKCENKKNIIRNKGRKTKSKYVPTSQLSIEKQEERRRRKSIWASNNREKANLAFKKWRKLHPEEWRHAQKNRRAKERGSKGTITKREWEKLCNLYGNKCLCCGDDTKKLTMDHIIPVKLGGLNVISNIQPLCRSCNSKKSAKHIDYRFDKGSLFMKIIKMVEKE